jgi:hypothetical protein
MTTLTLKRERDNTAGTAPSFGLLGAHPVESGFGAAAGLAAAGALGGTVVGPVGTLLGAVAGAVAGALAGDQIAEAIDASAEEAYWRENYSSRPYVTAGATFNEYRPAYRYGVDAHRRFEGRRFEEVEAELMRDWNRVKGTSSLTWENAKHASRDSWQRVRDFRSSDSR